MNDTKIKFKENLRHVSIRKKTASRICSTQVLYGASFIDDDIDYLVKSLGALWRQCALAKVVA